MENNRSGQQFDEGDVNKKEGERHLRGRVHARNTYVVQKFSSKWKAKIKYSVNYLTRPNISTRFIIHHSSFT